MDNIVDLNGEKKTPEEVVQDQILDNMKGCYALALAADWVKGVTGFEASENEELGFEAIYKELQEYIEEISEEEKNEILELTEPFLELKDALRDLLNKIG